jgi:hypothetical protein
MSAKAISNGEKEALHFLFERTALETDEDGRLPFHHLSETVALADEEVTATDAFQESFSFHPSVESTSFR